MKTSEINRKLDLLRKKAEGLLDTKAHENDVPLSEVEILTLIHELDVHQIELQFYAVHNMDFVEVSIADNGVGMSEESRKKLFLVSSDRSSMGTDGGKGSGMGLLLCKELVDKHGGKIWAESQVGFGSTFHFTIPSK